MNKVKITEAGEDGENIDISGCVAKKDTIKLEQYLDFLLKCIASLEERVDELEDKNRMDGPTGPGGIDFDAPTPIGPYTFKSICPKCKLDFSEPTSYVCNDPSCPMFPQITS